MDEQQGTIAKTVDCGTVVQVFVETDDGLRVLAADGRMWREALASMGRVSLVGVRILFEETDWLGGIEWFALAEDTDDATYCANCGRLIPPHLNPDFCVFGRHARRALKPSNGAHADE